MGDFAIRAEHVSKRYRRGLWAHETLRSFMASRLAQIRGRENIDTGWFDAKALSRLAEDHIAGRRDHARELWQLLMLERNVSLLSNN